MERKKVGYRADCSCGWVGKTYRIDEVGDATIPLSINNYELQHIGKLDRKTWLPGSTSTVDKVWIDRSDQSHSMRPNILYEETS